MWVCARRWKIMTSLAHSNLVLRIRIPWGTWNKFVLLGIWDWWWNLDPQTWLPNRDCSRTLYSQTISRQTWELSNKHWDKNTLNWRTCSWTSCIYFPSSWTYQICSTQIVLITCSMYTLCVAILVPIKFHISFKVTHNSLLNNVYNIKTCVTFFRWII